MCNIAISLQDSLNSRLSMHDAGKNASSWGRSPSQRMSDPHRLLSTLQIFVGSDGKGAPPKGEADGTCKKRAVRITVFWFLGSERHFISTVPNDHLVFAMFWPKLGTVSVTKFPLGRRPSSYHGSIVAWLGWRQPDAPELWIAMFVGVAREPQRATSTRIFIQSTTTLF